MGDKKLKQAVVDDSTIKVVRWEITNRDIRVPVDPEEPDGEMEDAVQKLITVHTRDGRKKDASHRSLLSQFIEDHSMESDEAVLNAVESALLSDLIANKYE